VTDAPPDPVSTDLATAWSLALAETGPSLAGGQAARSLLPRLAARITGTEAGERSCREAGREAARALVEGHYTDPESVAASIAALDGALPERFGRDARAALYGGLAEGFAHALRERTRAEQEQIRQAVISARLASEARFRVVFRNAALGIAIADRAGRVLEVNQRLARLLGVETRSLRGRDLRELKAPQDPPRYWTAYEDLLAGRRSHYSADKQLVREGGATIWTRTQASVVRDAHGGVELLIVAFEDITERREMNERLLHQATHDPLTALPNRTRLQKRLTELLREAAPGDRVGLCFLDLDGFKEVNDTFGHELGDRLLAAVARRLAAATDPQRHLLARMGGDEFVVLVPGTEGPHSVTEVADAVLAALREPVELDGHRLRVTASLGLVERAASFADPTQLLRAADASLYWAKSEGGARWALFDRERYARQKARRALAQALPAAIERGELFLEYQPIVDLAGGGVCAMEALVRWNHPERGLLGPDQFVPLAEETGAIVALGRWVLRRAVADAAAWPAGPDGRPVAVAVNVAVRQLREPGLHAALTEALAAGGLPARLLHLEITETAAMNPGEGGRALETLRALAGLGVRIVIDDFGTGYSNLAYLRRLPAHMLKIDASFVADLVPAAAKDGAAAEGADAGSGEAVVAGLITLAHACGMTVTAEGVETPEQAERLRGLGAETAQGYLYSRAVANERVPQLTSALAPAA